MKFQLNKLMAGLVMAGSAVALVGCGGGDAPDLLPKDIAATITSTDTAAIALASNVAVALKNEVIALTPTAATNLAVPTNSTLTFTGAGTGTGAIAAATITSGTQSLQTNVTAGSCSFTVTGPALAAQRITFPAAEFVFVSSTSEFDIYDAIAEVIGVPKTKVYKRRGLETVAATTEVQATTSTVYNIGDKIVVSPCAITAPVSDVQDGAPSTTRQVTITLGTGGTVTADATVERKDGKIIINGTPVANVTATGGITVN